MATVRGRILSWICTTPVINMPHHLLCIALQFLWLIAKGVLNYCEDMRQEVEELKNSCLSQNTAHGLPSGNRPLEVRTYCLRLYCFVLRVTCNVYISSPVTILLEIYPFPLWILSKRTSLWLASSIILCFVSLKPSVHTQFAIFYLSEAISWRSELKNTRT